MKATKEQILNTLKKAKPQLAVLGVERIGLFGSYATGNQDEYSDIDIFAELSQQDYRSVLKVLDYLDEILPARVDLTYNYPHLRASFLQSIQKEIVYA